MIREKAPTILTAEGARRLTARIRDALALADDLLVRAYEGCAWEALGHESWAEYVAAELPELRMMKLRKPERLERAEKLYAAGASEKDVAAATGASIGTAHNDAVTLGHSEMSAGPSPAQESRADQIVRLVAARGDRGATSVELMRLARCSYGAASGGLSRLHSQGRIRPTSMQRNGYGVYVVS